jgi:hypothetical protein
VALIHGYGGETHAADRYGIALAKLAGHLRRNGERDSTRIALDALDAPEFVDDAGEQLTIPSSGRE